MILLFSLLILSFISAFSCGFALVKHLEKYESYEAVYGLKSFLTITKKSLQKIDNVKEHKEYSLTRCAFRGY